MPHTITLCNNAKVKSLPSASIAEFTATEQTSVSSTSLKLAGVPYHLWVKKTTCSLPIRTSPLCHVQHLRSLHRPSCTRPMVNTPCSLCGDAQHAASHGTRNEVTSCLYNVVTPYNPHAWGISLCKAGLLYTYPNLILTSLMVLPSATLLLWLILSFPNNLNQQS